MNLENRKEGMCPHKVLCFEIENIRPVLYSSRGWNQKCWEAIRILISKSECQGLARSRILEFVAPLEVVQLADPLSKQRKMRLGSQTCSGHHSLSQWFSKCVLRPAASASLGNLLELQILRPYIRTLVSGAQHLCFNKWFQDRPKLETTELRSPSQGSFYR